ncbi:MAG: hypothetical protein CMF38_04880 [Legionellaceae bacterium]|nr:hypothetical protein [Legionellaceae bacterium]|tara:strand:- start:649 stop:843 length:195 start_codon:yes stop_codon:yes gene_type:complete
MLWNLKLVEAAGIEPATISRNSLIYMTLILDLPILGRKWGIFDGPYIPKEFRINLHRNQVPIKK